MTLVKRSALSTLIIPVIDLLPFVVARRWKEYLFENADHLHYYIVKHNHTLGQ